VAAIVRGSRKARGARLQLEFDVVPMFGDVRRTSWVDIGATNKASRSQRFKGLAANAWIGAVRYRFVKGGTVVEQGSLRSRSGRAGKASGRGVCTLPIGLIPIDALAPFVLANPSQDDGIWHRAPFTVSFAAADDLSGVASIDYTVNGVPGSGRSVTLTNDGIFSIDYSARDVAGNRSATLSTGAHVDASPPTTPAVTGPTGTTSDNTPTIGWTASTDAASGVQGYVVVIRDSGGNVVSAPNVGAGTTSISSPKLANGSYTAQVVAFDGAQPQPFVAGSGEQGFAVNNIVYSNNFSGTGGDPGCTGFTTPSPWTCSAPGPLSTMNPMRDCLTNTTKTATATSPVINFAQAIPANDLMRLTFSRTFGTTGDPSGFSPDDVDTGKVEVFLNGSGTAINSASYTSAASGPDHIDFTPSSATTSAQLKFTLILDGGIGCSSNAGQGLAVDDLALFRKP
jgi:hypothetical protein